MTKDLVDLVTQARQNNAQLVATSERVGCYHCGHVYRATLIEVFTSNGDAVCPACGVDAVIPEASGIALSFENLDAFGRYFFWGMTANVPHPEPSWDANLYEPIELSSPSDWEAFENYEFE